ncbi:MAG: tyrosine-type recombinase/integrase [bacterium]|jgi:integrase/recombinase XerD
MNQKIIKICEEKFIYLNYSPRTKDNYLSHIKDFLKSLGDKQIIHCNSKDFQSYLDNYKFTSISQQNQVINSIRFLYKFGLNKKYDKVSFKRPKSEKKLPKVIDNDYIIECLSKINNLKHKSILSLSYSVGLRVSEVVNLKIEDIDSKRMIIHIKNAKGRKDRVVPLSQNILELLRSYYKEFRPIDFLFNGQNNLKYSTGSCNQIVKKYLGEKYHIHQLRHSCATNLLENGTDLKLIQKILGHYSVKTTEIYTHVSNQLLSKVNLPI